MKGETTLEKVFLGEWQTAVYKCQTWESVDIKGFSGGCIDRYQMGMCHFGNVIQNLKNPLAIKREIDYNNNVQNHQTRGVCRRLSEIHL